MVVKVCANGSIILQLYLFLLYFIYYYILSYHLNLLYYLYFNYYLHDLYRPGGRQFEVAGYEVANLQVPPKKGAVMTFSYDNYTQGDIPVNPKIERIRHDLTWDDVINDQSPRPLSLNGIKKNLLFCLFFL